MSDSKLTDDTNRLVMKVRLPLVRVDQNIGIQGDHDPRLGSRVSSIEWLMDRLDTPPRLPAL